MIEVDDEHPSRAVTAWFAVVIFAYSYKAIVCGLLDHLLGVEFFCTPLIRGISVNHWIETLLYCPLLWFALHQVNADVFGGPLASGMSARTRARLRLAGDFAIAIVLYGTGVHIANVIEINAREEQGITDGELYELVYFLDEGLSHWLQFIPLFFVIGWFVVWDRPGRSFHPSVAVAFGVAHGVERAIGIIEGGKWFVGPPTVLWLAACVALRARRQGAAARNEFFVRYAIAFCLAHPVALVVYRARFGSFVQPSTLSDARLTEVIASAAAVVIVTIAVGGRREWRARSGAGDLSRR